MNYFDDNDELPRDEITKFLQEMQRHLFDSLQNGNLGSNVKRFGFSIHMGEDGVPHISPLRNHQTTNLGAIFGQDAVNNGFEEPFVDVFDNGDEVQIIAELPGISDLSMVHVTVNDNDFSLHAENGPHKYRKSILLKNSIAEDEMDMHLRNGVLEIIAKAQ